MPEAERRPFPSSPSHGTDQPFGTALYESLADPKRLTVLKAADHNDWVARVDDTWWREAVTFLLGDSR